MPADDPIGYDRESLQRQIARAQGPDPTDSAEVRALREALDVALDRLTAYIDDKTLVADLKEDREFVREARTALAAAPREAKTDDARSFEHHSTDVRTGERITWRCVPAKTDDAGASEGLRALVADGIEAFRLTREYVGEDTLYAGPGWSWFDWTEKARAALEEPG